MKAYGSLHSLFIGRLKAVALGAGLLALAFASAPKAIAADAPGADAPGADAPGMLTLNEAIDRTLASHPELKVFAAREVERQAAVEIAAQRPALSASLDVENIGAGSSATGGPGTETTLTLASVLERGKKREARQAVAAIEKDSLDFDRTTKRLDLMAEVARRYLDVARAQAQMQLADEDIAQRSRAVTEAARRVQAGATPESAQLTAEATVARAQVERGRAERQAQAAFTRLGLLWSERAAQVRPVTTNLTTLPEVPPFSDLLTLVQRTPEIQRYASEARLREARVQLQRSARTFDITWQVGVRRLEEEGKWAAVAGLSIPLGTAARAEPQIRAAMAERNALDVEREASELSLYETLAEAHGVYVSARTEVLQFDSEVLPRLVRAEQATQRAYRAGAVSYLEWAQVQNDIIEARQRRLAAADEAQRALIEIQRLTAEPFVDAAR